MNFPAPNKVEVRAATFVAGLDFDLPLFGKRRRCYRFGMRKRRVMPGLRGPARFRWGAWFGLLALALNALVPIHIAFDLAEDLAASSPRIAAAERDTEWRVLAFLTGHFHRSDTSDRHHKQDRTDCAVCNSVGTLAGFAPAAPVATPLPPLFVFTAFLPAAAESTERTPAAAYHSRAPPLA